MKLCCRLKVIRGSGSSLSHILRTLVTLFISEDHSDESRSTESRSDRHKTFKKDQRETCEPRPTFIQKLFEFLNFTCRTTQSIYTLRIQTILLNRFTAFPHDRWNIHIVSDHLLSQIHTKGWSPFVREMYSVGIRRYRYIVVMCREWW